MYLAPTGSQPTFIIQQTEDLDVKASEWQIREKALDLQRDEKPVEAAKLYIKLIVNSVDMPIDLKNLNSIIYNLINNNSETGIKDFNISEIQTIMFSCKKEVPFHIQDEERAAIIYKYFESKSNDG